MDVNSLLDAETLYDKSPSRLSGMSEKEERSKKLETSIIIYEFGKIMQMWVMLCI